MIRIDLSLRNLLVILGVLVGLWLLTKLWGVVLLAAVGLLLAAALLPYVEWLRRRIDNRPLAVLLVVLSVLAAVALALLIIVPPMIDQGRALWEEAPEFQERAARFAEERDQRDLAARIREFEWAQLSDEASSQAVATGRTALAVMLALFTVFFLAAYFMLDAERLKAFLYFSTPRDWHPHIKALLPALQRVVGGYIRGQAITSGAIFVFTFIVLTVMRVPNAIALAAIAAIADLIPLVGVYILTVVVTLPALAVSLTAGVVVVGAMIIYQQFEDRVLIPRVYGATLRLPTIAVVLAILAGAELLGIVGALLALPLAAAVRVTVEYFAHARTAPAREAADAATPDDEPFAPREGAAPVADSGRASVGANG
jgi:predicted PurR-regulated permease PerM